MSRLARASKYAFSPDFRVKYVPDFNGGDGLTVRGYSPVAGGGLLRERAGRPSPLFTQRSMYGLGLAVSPIQPGESFADLDALEARFVPRKGFGCPGKLSRPPRTLLIMRRPGTVPYEDYFAALAAQAPRLTSRGILIQTAIPAAVVGLGIYDLAPPLVQPLPRERASLRVAQLGSEPTFPVYDYADPGGFRCGEVLIVDNWNSAVFPGAFVQRVDGTITDSLSGETSDGFDSQFSFDLKLRLDVPPVLDQPQYVYWASYSDTLGDAKTFAAGVAKNSIKYRHSVLHPPPLEEEAGIAESAQGYILDDSFATAEEFSGSDADSYVDQIFSEAEDFFSRD